MHLVLATRLARTLSMAVVVCVGAGVGPWAAPAHATPRQARAQASPSWDAIPVPVPIDELAAAAGVPSPAAPELFLFDLIRVVHERPIDSTDLPESPLANVLSVLRNARSSGAIPTAQALVPLPLSPETWCRVVFGRSIDREAIVEAILEDRRASLLYLGLGALDAETLALLEANEALLAVLARDHAAVLAAFGRSISVQGGLVRLPLADESRPAWEALVGAPAADPGAFLPALLGRDRGRLAYFLDAITALDEPHQRFVMGLARPEGAPETTGSGNGGAPTATDRTDAGALAAAYGPVSTASAEWNVDVHPFYRPAFDPAVAIRAVRVTDRGNLAPPASRVLWERVFSRWRAALAAPSRSPGRDDVDAPWLLSQWVGSSYRDASVKLEQMRVAQRVFETGRQPDAPALKDAIDAVARYPALVLTLERLGISDPARHAAAAAVAQEVTDRASRHDGFATLSMFQGLLATIERSYWAGTLEERQASDLAGELLAQRPTPGGDFDAQLLGWLERTLLPVFGSTTGVPPAVRAEEVVLAALAGVRREAADEPPALVEWEGQPYRLDPAGGALARLERLRELLPSPSLDVVLALHRTIGELQRAGASTATSAELSGLLADVDGLLPLEGEGRVFRESFERGRRVVERIRGRAEGRRASAGELRDLGRLRNVLAADVIRLLAYLPSLGDPTGAARLGGQVARRHRFDVQDAFNDAAEPAWSIPHELVTEGGGWHVRGSLLGLDVGLARLALHRLDVDRIPYNPRLDDRARRPFATAVVLARPADVTDAQRDEIGRAVTAGRARVADAGAAPGALAAIAAAIGLDARRTHALRWAVGHLSADPLTRFAPGEVVRLGAREPLGLEIRTIPDASCLAGADACGHQLSDLAVRLLEGLAVRRLPAALLPGMLASATQDLLDETQAIYPGDEQAIWQFIRELRSERLDDYIAVLAGAGPLAPPEARALPGSER